MENIANEKLCFRDWLDEYVEVLNRENKLDETISRYEPEIDIEQVGDNQAKKDLVIALCKDKDRSDEMNMLYFDYLCAKGVYHLY